MNVDLVWDIDEDNGVAMDVDMDVDLDV